MSLNKYICYITCICLVLNEDHIDDQMEVRLYFFSEFCINVTINFAVDAKERMLGLQ